MKRLIDGLTEYSARSGSGRFLPEHRELKMYSNNAGYMFLGDDKGVPSDLAIPGLMNPLAAFMLLDTYLESRDPDLEGMTLRERYQALPRTGRVNKLVAQIYRLLRVLRIAFLREEGVIEESQGCIRAGSVTNGTAFLLIITRTGLALAESFVICYLNLLRQPYGEAYQEALLSRYYADITNEIKKFHDEDADILRYRNKYAFNRHCRFDCGNSHYEIQDDYLVFDILDTFNDPLLYPIDFFVTVENDLYVIPIEALRQKKLPLAELPQWKSRTLDERAASPQFLIRSGYEAA